MILEVTVVKNLFVYILKIVQDYTVCFRGTYGQEMHVWNRMTLSWIKYFDSKLLFVYILPQNFCLFTFLGSKFQFKLKIPFNSQISTNFSHCLTCQDSKIILTHFANIKRRLMDKRAAIKSDDSILNCREITAQFSFQLLKTYKSFHFKTGSRKQQ